jgi:hypothetical protein
MQSAVPVGQGCCGAVSGHCKTDGGGVDLHNTGTRGRSNGNTNRSRAVGACLVQVAEVTRQAVAACLSNCADKYNQIAASTSMQTLLKEAEPQS